MITTHQNEQLSTEAHQKLSPDEIDLARALEQKNSYLEGEVNRLNQENKLLWERIRLLIAQRYGRRSESFSVPHAELPLFDEAEQANANPPKEEEEEANTVTVESHPRRKRGRRPLPPELPREEVVHDLPEADRVCGLDQTPMVEIGREISEQLDVIPAQVRVIRHVRIKYGCPHCHQGVLIAPLPLQPLPKSIATPGLLAHVVVCKYEDALPLYRQEHILQRIGVELPRATLANWVIKAGELVQPIINLLRDELLGYDIIKMDETTMQVLNEPNKSVSSKSFFWVQCGGPPGKNVILFDYDPSRGGAVAKVLLGDFCGFLQTDGYVGYRAIGLQPNIVHLGCWAHARRKFDEALKGAGREAAKNRKGVAGEALKKIQTLYAIEKRLRVEKATPEQRLAVRQAEAKPILNEIFSWVKEQIPRVLPSSLTGKALGYLRDQQTNLSHYIEDGRLEIDNNGAENAIRPFVMGRKNWLFSSSVAGANASANLYSIIQTAKANGLDAYRYLRHIFSQLPSCRSIEDVEKLLPWNFSESVSEIN